MKRHESLAPLSREHHPTLILAQLLKKNAPAYKGMPTEPPAKAAYALDLFLKDIQKHFAKEELLLGKLTGVNPEIDSLAKEIITEHQQLTDEFIGLQSPNNLVEQLDILGHRLEQHIRKEERVLFPLIEQYCTTSQLDDLALFLH